MSAVWSANRLLAAMAPDDRARLLRSVQLVELVKNDDLVLPHEPIRHCWFPMSGLISLIGMDDAGGEAEVGMIGREGVADVSALLGDRQSALRMLVQIGGSALRIEAAVVADAMSSSPELTKLMMAYVRAFTIQITSSAISYAIYPIPKRLARWLLMSADRTDSCEIPLTHETLSIMLGVRRAGVTVAIRSLVAQKLIEARRGVLQIVDRNVLATFAGSSYGEPEREYERLIP